MPQNWTRMSRDDAHAVLAKLAGRRDAVVFSRDTTEVSVRSLPFYRMYKLYRVINYATMPTFTMLYLTDGTDFIPIDGTANPIYLVNEKDRVHLNETNVIPYLDFFFGNVQGAEGDVFIIKDPKKMPFMDSLSTGQQQSIVTSFRPLKVSYDAVSQTHKVTGTIYYGGGLIAAAIKVSGDGRLSFQEQTMLLSGIHFPQSPYGQAWLDG